MTERSGITQPRRRRPGFGLIIGGAAIALAFAAFLMLAPGAGIPAPSPLWIAVIWGVLMVAFGAYRLFRGPSKLDHPRGGTGADGR